MEEDEPTSLELLELLLFSVLRERAPELLTSPEPSSYRLVFFLEAREDTRVSFSVASEPPVALCFFPEDFVCLGGGSTKLYAGYTPCRPAKAAFTKVGFFVG